MSVRAVPLSALSMPTGLALASDAPFSDPSSLPKVSCDDIQYSEAMLDVAGNPVETFSLKPAPNDKIVIDGGKNMSFSDLKAGDVVTFWKSEKRLDTKAMPADTAASWLVLPPQRLSQK